MSSTVNVTLSPARRALNNKPSCTLKSELAALLVPTVPSVWRLLNGYGPVRFIDLANRSVSYLLSGGGRNDKRVPMAANAKAMRELFIICSLWFAATGDPAPPSLTFHRSLVQRSPDPVCQLDGVVVGPKVDEEHARLFVEHVTVNRRYLDIASTQRADERIDLAVRY
jgi:hypothetical protein